MNISKSGFDSLCHDAGQLLDVLEPEALSQGEPFVLQDVKCRLHFSEPRSSAFLRYELGDPEPDCEADALRQLLEIQTALFGMLDAAFGHDPVDDSLFFMVRLQLPDNLPAQAFAQAVSQFALQVRQWRDHVLVGKLIDYEREFEKMFPASAGSLQEPGRGAVA
ncbi:MAG: CesT family type III secretion system chaperone [Pseudomonadota bacterium]